jgi:hypothetical protein
MVAYSFRPRFVAPILAGTKRQTIRADRKRHARPGEEMQLYTGMRTKHCKLIARMTCDRVEPITLNFCHHGSIAVLKEGRLHPVLHLDAFARSDGFGGWDEMREFWREAHGDISEWTGVLLTWRPIA